MVIHESHQMILTPIGTTECNLCWACDCHADPAIFAAECKKTFITEEIPD